MNFKLPKSKKGVSPIIATLLLIVIAVAAAVVTYSFVMGFIGTSTNPSGQQGQMSIDSATLNNTHVTVYVRNIGSKPLTVDSVYVAGVKADIGGTTEIAIGKVEEVSGTLAASVTSGQSYVIKVVCTDGTTVEISRVAQ